MTDPLDAWKPWPLCPADKCGEAKGVTIFECVPGYTYTTIGDVCGHTVFLHRKPDTAMTDDERELWEAYFHATDVPRETSTDQGEQ